MELYKGSLYWPTTLANVEVPEYPALNKEISCDCLIVGGGMSGALCAYLLANESLDIVLVDKRKVSTGSSSANTGLLQYANDKMLHEFAEAIGEEKAVRFYQLCYKAMKKLQDVAKSLDSDVQFHSRKSLYYATDENDIEKLQKEYKILTKHGFDAQYLTEEEIEKTYGFKKPAALLTSGDAEINPQQFVIELIKEAHQQNVQVFEHTEVAEAEFVDGYWKLTSDKGIIYAKRVIYSTGYEGINFAKKEGGELKRTYAIATSPLPEFPMWEGRCLIWETKRPYFYMRTTVDGRVVAGGLDEDQIEAPSNHKTLAQYGDNLLKRIKEHFPSYPIEVEYVYGATFGESDDGIPYIGEHPEKNNIFYCLGYGGNGTVYSMFGAEILKDLIIHGSHPDWDLVQLNR